MQSQYSIVLTVLSDRKWAVFKHNSSADAPKPRLVFYQWSVYDREMKGSTIRLVIAIRTVLRRLGKSWPKLFSSAAIKTLSTTVAGGGVANMVMLSVPCVVREGMSTQNFQIFLC